MTGALSRLRSELTAQLNRAGIPAMAAYEPERQVRRTEPVAAVSLAKVVCAPGGFRDYLGRRTAADGTEEELYGRAAELTLALDIYAPRDGGESAARETMERLAEELAGQGAAGLTVLELESGQAEFLESRGLYRLPVKCVCRGWLTAAAREGGAFVDIEVRGKQK